MFVWGPDDWDLFFIMWRLKREREREKRKYVCVCVSEGGGGSYFSS